MSYIEDAIVKTGWGLCSKLLIGFAALCYFSNATAFMSLPIYLPTISCDVSLTDLAITNINIVTSVGLAFGGFFFSSISDVVGRKQIITLTLVLIFISILSISFTYGPITLGTSQFILGSALSANFNVIKIYLAECLPIFKRPQTIIFLDIFSRIGIIFSVSAALGFLPLLFEFRTDIVRVFSWRLLLGFSGFLSITMACVSALIVQSPRYLLYERRTSEALNVLREMFAINNSKMFNNYKETELDLQGKIGNFGINVDHNVPRVFNSRKCILTLKRMQRSILILANRNFFVPTTLSILLRVATSSGFFILNMFLTKTLIFEENCHVDSLNILHFDHPTLRNCRKFSSDITVYRDFIALCAMSIVGQILMMNLISYIERKYLIVSGLFLTGVFSVLLAFIKKNYPFRFVISTLLVIAYTGVESVLGVIVIEMFPTAVRGTALGEIQILQQLLIIFMKKYLDLSCQWSFIGIGVISEVGAALAFALPKFKNRPMVD